MLRKGLIALMLVGMGQTMAFAQGEVGSTTSAAGTDHGAVLNTIGIQGIASAAIANPGGGNIQTDILGIRYWFRERIGFEAGFGIALANGGGNTAVGFGFGGGLPIVLTIHKHITTFVEPFADVFIYSPGGNANSVFQLDIRGDIGFEWQLGMLETHTLALIFKVGPGLRIISNGGTSVLFGTTGQSAVGTLSAAGGLVFYL